MKWQALNREQLTALARWLSERAAELRADRESIEEEEGFDLVAGLKSVSRKLRREAKRRVNAEARLRSAFRQAIEERALAKEKGFDLVVALKRHKTEDPL